MNKYNIFSKIVNHEVSSDIVYQDNYVTAFNDIKPKTPIHIILVPNIYIKNMNEIKKNNLIVLGKLLYVSSVIAKKKNIQHNGYRIVINCNKNAGQEIDYLHLHLLGGCNMGDFVCNKNIIHK